MVIIFNKDLANAFVRARGRCEYCGSDLLMSRQGYAISEIDHLLPRSTFLKLESEPNNHVLFSRKCNGVKSTFNPLEESGIKDHKVAKQMLEGEERSELMDRARAKIAERMEEHDKVWREVTEILS